jgi:hypothetical protein
MKSSNLIQNHIDSFLNCFTLTIDDYVNQVYKNISIKNINNLRLFYGTSQIGKEIFINKISSGKRWDFFLIICESYLGIISKKNLIDSKDEQINYKSILKSIKL